MIRPAVVGREEPPSVGASILATAATSPHDCSLGKATCASSDMSHAPLASPSSAASSVSIVHGAASGPAPSVVAFIRPKNAPALTLPCLIGRNPQLVRMFSNAEWSDAARSGVLLRQDASSGAERGVAADLLVRRLRVPEEVAGRVHGDHHRAVDALRVAPGVDHRRARPGALAHEIDAAVAERAAARPRGRRPAAAGCSRRGRRRRAVSRSAQARNASARWP